MEIILNRLKNHYEPYYDLKEQPTAISQPLDLYAHFHQTNQRYFASKKINLWRLDTEEHCLVQTFRRLGPDDLALFTQLLKNSVETLVKPHPDHMKTYITGVLLVDTPVSPPLIQLIQDFKYSKSFKFFLYGWCDIRLILLDLSCQQVFYNKAAKEVRTFYQSLLERTN